MGAASFRQQFIQALEPHGSCWLGFKAAVAEMCKRVFSPSPAEYIWYQAGGVGICIGLVFTQITTGV